MSKLIVCLLKKKSHFRFTHVSLKMHARIYVTSRIRINLKFQTILRKGALSKQIIGAHMSLNHIT